MKEWPDFQIPAEWSLVRMDDLAVKLKAGGTPSRKNNSYFGGDIPFVLIDDITSSGVYLNSTKETISRQGLDACSAWIVPENTVLLSMYATIGATVITRFPVATNQAILAIIPHENCDREYLSFCLQAHKAHLARLNIESTQKNINKGIVSSFPIPLPPPPEQKKIAHILSTVQRAIEVQDRIIQTTTELKKALMHKLFTEGLRNEPQKQTEIGPVPESWDVVPLEQIAESFQYGTSVKCGYAVNGKAVLRIPNVVGGAVNIGDLKYGQPKPNELVKHKLQSGDLLFVRTNGVKANAGRCSLFDDEIEDCYYASYLIRVRLNPATLNSTFLNEFSRTAKGSSFLSGKAIRTADGKFNINSGTLKKMLIPVPAIAEQNDIARTLSLMDVRSTSARAKNSTYDDLFRTLLHELMTAKTRVHELALKA